MCLKPNCSSKECTSVFILPIWELVTPRSRNVIRTLYEIKNEEMIYSLQSGADSPTTKMLIRWGQTFENFVDAILLMEIDAPDLALDIYNQNDAAAVLEEMERFMDSTSSVICRMKSVGIRSRAASHRKLCELRCKVELWHAVTQGIIRTMEC